MKHARKTAATTTRPRDPSETLKKQRQRAPKHPETHCTRVLEGAPVKSICLFSTNFPLFFCAFVYFHVKLSKIVGPSTLLAHTLLGPPVRARTLWVNTTRKTPNNPSLKSSLSRRHPLPQEGTVLGRREGGGGDGMEENGRRGLR